MSRVSKIFIDDDPCIFITTIPDGIPINRLKSYCEASYTELNDYFEDGRHYIPSGQLTSIFRYIVKILPKSKEGKDFPIKKISSIEHSQNKGTNGNRVLLNQPLIYKIKVLCELVEKNGFLVQAEISRSSEDIILWGIYGFLK